MKLCPTTGKRCETKAAAKAHARRLQYRAVLLGDRRMSAYRCPDAHLHPGAVYHVGHTPSKRKRKGVL